MPKTKSKTLELDRPDFSKIEGINITFNMGGKLYLLMPKQGATMADINIKSVLRLAFDTHHAVEILDPDIENLRETLNEVMET